MIAECHLNTHKVQRGSNPSYVVAIPEMKKWRVPHNPMSHLSSVTWFFWWLFFFWWLCLSFSSYLISVLGLVDIALYLYWVTFVLGLALLSLPPCRLSLYKARSTPGYCSLLLEGHSEGGALFWCVLVTSRQCVCSVCCVACMCGIGFAVFPPLSHGLRRRELWVPTWPYYFGKF